MSIARLCQSLIVVSTVLFGCGGVAEETVSDCVRLDADAPELTEARPDATFVEGPVEKFISVNFNGSEVHIPDEYGDYRGASEGSGGETVCANSAMSWAADCVVSPQARTVKLCFDQTACDAIGNFNFTSKMNQAMWDLQAWLWLEGGWFSSAMNGSDGTCNVVLKCDTLTGPGIPPTAVGGTFKSVGTCWNLPGYPRDVCFTTGARVAYVYVQKIINDYGSGTSGQWKVYNTALHELGHSMAFGHQSSSAIMAPGTAPGELVGPLSWQTYERDAARNFNRDFDPCNWQPGDPVGASCPNE